MFYTKLIIGMFLFLSIFPLNGQDFTKSFSSLIKKRPKTKRLANQKHHLKYCVGLIENDTKHEIKVQLKKQPMIKLFNHNL